MARFQLRRLLGISRLRGGDSLRESPTPPAPQFRYYLVNPTEGYTQLGENETINGRRANRLARFFPPVTAALNVYRLDGDVFTTREPPSPALVVSAWYGGHENEVSQAESDLLVAAGYTVNQVEV